MKITEVVATLAIAGAVATFALLNLNQVPQGTNFLSSGMTEAEIEFNNFMSQFQRTYGTVDEYK